MTIKELKADAYDLIAQMEAHEQQKQKIHECLRQLNLKISELSKKEELSS